MCFELDDWPHFQFNFDPSRVGLSAPSKVLEIWQGELDCMHEHVDGGVLDLAMHPQVIGRGAPRRDARALRRALPRRSASRSRARCGRSQPVEQRVELVGDREHLAHVAAADQQPVDGRAGEQVDHQLEVDVAADLAAIDRPLQQVAERLSRRGRTRFS